jgi:hypothetical protein
MSIDKGNLKAHQALIEVVQTIEDELSGGRVSKFSGKSPRTT